MPMSDKGARPVDSHQKAREADAQTHTGRGLAYCGVV